MLDEAPRRLQKLLADPAHRRSFALIVLSAALLLSLWYDQGLRPFGLALLPAGLLAWTFLEYWLHRVLFHLPRTHPLAFLGASMHADHHDAPNAPPITKPPGLTLGTLWLVFLALGWTLPWTGWAPFFAGAALGYLGYEVSHVAAHVLRAHEHPLPLVQRHHLAHHQTPSARFGITSPLWDWVFRT